MKKGSYPDGILWDPCLEELAERQALGETAEQNRQRWQALGQKTDFCGRLSQGASLYRIAAQRIFAILDGVTRRIPLPRGFFADREARRVAVTEVCRGLSLLEEAVQSLRESVAFYGSLREQLQGYLAALVRIEAEWRLSDPQEEEARNRASHRTDLTLPSLCEERRRVEALMVEIPAFCDTVTGFCMTAWTSFCREVSRAADLSHNGEEAQIAVLLQLLDALRGSAEGLPRAPDVSGSFI